MAGPTSSRRESALPRVDAFLDAKLHPPTVRANWLARDRLLLRVERSVTECPLTLVAAPAGYGKTTVIAQWIGRLAGRRQVAWVALDAADNDPVRFWTHVATALERAGCVFDGGAVRIVARHRSDISSGLLPEIVNALAEAPSPVLLALDDYHFVRVAACHEQIGLLIEHLPPRTAVLVLTRADPALHLGRLRAAGQLSEIRADDLAFDQEEAKALLEMEGIELSPVALSELMQRTEGWPAGLYLATMSLIGRDDPDAFVHQFTGDNRYIGDYLVEEVLSRQQAEVRAFMLRVSILERFSPSVCEYVLEMPRAGRILHDLERSNLFVVPLDASRKWFRFHHLFAAVARSELEAEDPALVSRLHARAVDWFRSHGFVDEAVEHAIAGGSTARAARLVQANWTRYVDAGRAATVDGWLRALRAPALDAEPAALVTAAWMAVVRGDEASVKGLLLALDHVEDDGPLPDGTRSVESAVALIQGMSGYGGPREMARAAQRANELETDVRSPWFGFARLVRGHERYVAGDLDAGQIALSDAAYNENYFAITRQFALALMSMVARESRQDALSRRYAGEAMAVMEAASLRAVPQASLSLTAWAESRAADGDLTGALEMLDEVTTVRRRSPGLSPWPTFHHLLATARVTTMAGDESRAERVLDEAARQMARFTEGMDAMHARVAHARAALRRLRLEDSGEQSLTAREVDVLRMLRSRLSLSEIASELYLTRNTVKTHARAVYRKLGASSRSEAVRLGHRRALI